jgi:hypothetical protein
LLLLLLLLFKSIYTMETKNLLVTKVRSMHNKTHK